MSGLRALLSLERVFLATALLGVALGIVAALLYARADPAAAVVVRLPGHIDPHPRFPAASSGAPRPAPAEPAAPDTAELVVDVGPAPAEELEGDGIGRVLAESAGGVEEPFLPPAPAEPEPALPADPAPPPAPPETPAEDQYGDPAVPPEAETGNAGEDGEDGPEGDGTAPGGFVLPLPGSTP